MKFYAHITYTDRFVVEAKSKAEAREVVRKNWQQFGAQYDKLRIEVAPDSERPDKWEDSGLYDTYVTLERLVQEGLSKEAEVECLRSAMDLVWYRLTDTEQRRLNKRAL